MTTRELINMFYLEQQRDDLLDALKEIRASEVRCKKRGIGYDEHIHNIAKIAIAKATQQAD